MATGGSWAGLRAVALGELLLLKSGQESAAVAGALVAVPMYPRRTGGVIPVPRYDSRGTGEASVGTRRFVMGNLARLGRRGNENRCAEPTRRPAATCFSGVPRGKQKIVLARRVVFLAQFWIRRFLFPEPLDPPIRNRNGIACGFRSRIPPVA